MTRLFVHAVNVHQGGGAVLLADLLRVIPKSLPTLVTVDVRMVLPRDLSTHIYVKRIKPTLLGRIYAELLLLRKTRFDDKVFCFGNLPPLLGAKGEVSVFIQNRYLVDPISPLASFSMRSRLRITVEKFWLYFCRHRADRFIAQTPTMCRLIVEKLNTKVVCIPYAPKIILEFTTFQSNQSSFRFDFIYVASGEIHKNHSMLIRAWAVLADEGFFPTLAVTLSPHLAPKLISSIKDMCISRGVRIHNLGVLPHEKLMKIYGNCGALIYPSIFESFGLPLIEAQRAGMAVLASELDYVRDVINPHQTFDPHSPVSIARAVKRYMNNLRENNMQVPTGSVNTEPVVPLEASEFLERLLHTSA